jgi:hypothetical protein
MVTALGSGEKAFADAEMSLSASAICEKTPIHPTFKNSE